MKKTTFRYITIKSLKSSEPGIYKKITWQQQDKKCYIQRNKPEIIADTFKNKVGQKTVEPHL